MMRRTVVALLVALTACGSDESDDGPCPTIACLFSISVANPPAEPYRVEATAPGQANPQVFQAPAPCGGLCRNGMVSI